MFCKRLHITKMLFRSLLLLWLFFPIMELMAQSKQNPIIVDQRGKGDFTSIQAAINSLPEEALQPRIIFIRKGIYQEKIFIEKNFVSLIGEDKLQTQLVISLARDIWRCENKDDWGVATINLQGSDILLENLTITNRYGLDNPQSKHIDCPSDSLNHFKTVKTDGHQMALRSFGTSRLIVRNCHLLAYGGDTVSPWNVEAGMFYFKDCLMEGGVDFYCPRGWAYAENCEFVAHSKTAAIWHDGSAIKDAKTVLVNCRFSGDDGFKLGRYHRDAQFYLINCSFPKNMSDTPIYLNPSNPQNRIQWGHRVYFYNSHKAGGDLAWHADNLEQAVGSPKAAQINLSWTFAGKWLPDANATDISKYTINKKVPALITKVFETKETDFVAENMLVYQRSIGGWPKAVNEVVFDYQKKLTEQEIQIIKADSLHKDATIDNSATTKEIRYLAKAYKKTGNKNYLKAVEKGVSFLLKAQYANGGWPQYYPDTAIYRSQITYNDNAMVNVLNVLQDILEQKNDMGLIDPSYLPAIKDAVQRGVACMLATQIIVRDTLTAWCAQYNRRTLQPEMARKFELVSLSGNESVGITLFLMRIKNPSIQIQKAINAAVDWFRKVQIVGFTYKDIVAPNEPKGKDRVLLPEAGSVVWARFYEISNNRPFFSGRDSQKKYDLKEIEVERRTGYGWYGTWPKKLLEEDYPKWLQSQK